MIGNCSHRVWIEWKIWKGYGLLRRDAWPALGAKKWKITGCHLSCDSLTKHLLRAQNPVGRMPWMWSGLCLVLGRGLHLTRLVSSSGNGNCHTNFLDSMRELIHHTGTHNWMACSTFMIHRNMYNTILLHPFTIFFRLSRIYCFLMDSPLNLIVIKC